MLYFQKKKRYVKTRTKPQKTYKGDAAMNVNLNEETYLERIKKLKSQKKITNDKLSELTGIPLGTLSKILAGSIPALFPSRVLKINDT